MPARQAAISAALKNFMTISLKLRVRVDLQGIYPERRAPDLIRRDVAHRYPGIQRQAPGTAEDPTPGIGAAEAKVRIGEGIDHGVAADALVPERHPPAR